MNRFFTASETPDAYHLPKHVHEQLLAEVAPVEKDDQGKPLFLEAHVDAWLTGRYSVSPWRSGSGLPNAVSNIKQCEDSDGFVTVSEAQRRYLAGQMSKRWWYRMAKIGKIAYHRVGDAILFRPADIEKFIEASRKAPYRSAQDRTGPGYSRRAAASEAPGSEEAWGGDRVSVLSTVTSATSLKQPRMGRSFCLIFGTDRFHPS